MFNFFLYKSANATVQKTICIKQVSEVTTYEWIHIRQKLMSHRLLNCWASVVNQQASADADGLAVPLSLLSD